MMKRIASFVLCAVMLLTLCACGDVSNAATHEVESELYTQSDINSAINVTKRQFRRNWNGCTLTEIYYAGDEVSKDHQKWADRNGLDEVIVLISSFDVDSSGGDGSLNPDSTYKNWMWILGRSKGGQWQPLDHGY